MAAAHCTTVLLWPQGNSGFHPLQDHEPGCLGLCLQSPRSDRSLHQPQHPVNHER